MPNYRHLKSRSGKHDYTLGGNLLETWRIEHAIPRERLATALGFTGAPSLAKNWTDGWNKPSRKARDQIEAQTRIPPEAWDLPGVQLRVHHTREVRQPLRGPTPQRDWTFQEILEAILRQHNLIHTSTRIIENRMRVSDEVEVQVIRPAEPSDLRAEISELRAAIGYLHDRIARLEHDRPQRLDR